MRYAVIAALTVAFVLTGCGVELLGTTAIQSGLQAEQMKSMRGQIKNAAGTTGRINLERAIATYQGEKGVYPPSLAALVPDYLPQLPAKADGTAYGYAPGTGKLLDAAAAASLGPTAADQRLMQQIRTAMAQYGRATGYYPPTLDDLAPQYLPSAPRTSGGEHFIYNNQDGYLAHPRQQQATPTPQRAARAPRGAAGASGVGPMGEVMTGIGIQNQLNQMGNSGVNSAGSRSRRAVRGLGQDHNQRQNKTMDELGL